MKSIVRFLRDEEGVTAIEYGLLASLIAVAIIIGRYVDRHALERRVQLHRRQRYAAGA